jgi:hypothetical protein
MRWFFQVAHSLNKTYGHIANIIFRFVTDICNFLFLDVDLYSQNGVNQSGGHSKKTNEPLELEMQIRGDTYNK